MSYLGMPPPDDERLFDLNFINNNWENENENITNNIGIPIENKEDFIKKEMEYLMNKFSKFNIQKIKKRRGKRGKRGKKKSI